MLKQLYGPKESQNVAHLTESIDPLFAKLVDEFAYGTVWPLEGLSLREKSLITISALIASGKELQTEIHMKAFLTSCGKADDLRNLLAHLSVYAGFPAAMNGFLSLNRVLGMTTK